MSVRNGQYNREFKYMDYLLTPDGEEKEYSFWIYKHMHTELYYLVYDVLYGQEQTICLGTKDEAEAFITVIESGITTDNKLNLCEKKRNIRKE
jgi:hypothetical protein